MKKRIFIDVTNFLQSPTTGIQRVVSSFSRALLHTQHTYTVCALKETQDYGLYALKSIIDDTDLDSESITFNEMISVEDIQSGDIFFDIDAVWNNKFSRISLYETLTQNNVKVCALIHDILPLKYPNYFNENTLIYFMRFVTAIVNNNVHIFTLTNHVKESIKQHFKNQIDVIGFGNFEKLHFKSAGEDVNKIEKLGDFILSVGTIEPRKNYDYLLKAFDSIANNTKLNLVIVGKEGWNCSQLMNKITNHELYGTRILFMSHISDYLLDKLYAKAWACVQASIDEGLGLPIVEALQYKKVVFCSDIPVFREVGSDFCIFFSLDLPESLSKSIITLYNNKDIAEKYAIISSAYTTDDWEKPSSNFINCISNRNYMETSVPSQALLLTANARNAITTVHNFSLNLLFISKFLIICPNVVKEEIFFRYTGKASIDFITDEELLDEEEITNMSDHALRNFTLRCRVLKSAKLDNVFISTDDDYRALTPIDRSFFVSKDKYNAYYFYKIEKWRGSPKHTSYDHGVKNTYNILCKKSMPTYQFSSHMPQVINKEIFLEAIEYFGGLTDSSYSEWDIYFNYAINKYREYFLISKYATIFWPLYPTDYEVMSLPNQTKFENFYDISPTMHSEAHTAYNMRGAKYNEMSYFEKINLYKDTFFIAVYCERLLKAMDRRVKFEPQLSKEFILRFINNKFSFNTPPALFFICNNLKKESLRINEAVSHLLTNVRIVYDFSNEYIQYECEHTNEIHTSSNVYELNIYPPSCKGNYEMKISIYSSNVLLASNTLEAIIIGEEEI